LTPEYTVYNQFQTFGILKDMKDEDIEKELIYWLNRFNITEYLNKKIKNISKGNRQKLQFIVAIMHNPKLLILDEPFSGLDPVSILEFKDIILELKNKGTTIIFSSHRMEHVEMLCDDILFIHEGKELLKGNLKEIKENYNIKKIKVSGKLNNFKDDNVIKIYNNKKDNYELFVKVDNVDNVINNLKGLEYLNYSLEDLDLEDIFIDKVGVKYEE
jgi:ABC-2 type transport system ATP-binding protein